MHVSLMFLFSGFSDVGGVAAAAAVLLAPEALRRDAARELVPLVLAVAAGSFIYVATADLIPGLHRQVRIGASIRQVALVLAGTATIALLSHQH